MLFGNAMPFDLRFDFLELVSRYSWSEARMRARPIGVSTPEMKCSQSRFDQCIVATW
jgi:hypothetical protein